MVFRVLFPFNCRNHSSSQMSLFLSSLMSRSLAEAQAKARRMSSGGSVAFTPPPLPLPDRHSTKPRLSSNPQNHIIPSPLRPLVPASQCFTNWLTPYGIAHLDKLSLQYPLEIIIRHHLCLANSVQSSTLSNYSAGLLRFTKFCNNYNIPELECMPALESLLSLFISALGAASVGKGTMKTWLEGLWLWHEINEAPWHGGRMLRRVVAGASRLALADSVQPKCDPVTIEHLRSLHCNLNLSDSFDIAVFAIVCIAFWCCCRYYPPTYENVC